MPRPGSALGPPVTQEAGLRPSPSPNRRRRPGARARRPKLLTGTGRPRATQWPGRQPKGPSSARRRARRCQPEYHWHGGISLAPVRVRVQVARHDSGRRRRSRSGLKFKACRGRRPVTAARANHDLGVTVTASVRHVTVTAVTVTVRSTVPVVGRGPARPGAAAPAGCNRCCPTCISGPGAKPI